MKSPHDPRLVAVDLALLLLQTMQEPEKPGQPARTQSPEVNAALTGWINTHWRSAGDAQDPQADRAAEAALLAITNPKERDFCLRFMARAGHLYQIAAQASAAGYMATMNTNPVADFLKAEGRRPYTNAKQAVEALNKPAFELTLTAHPTNTSSVPSMMEERSLGLALQAMQTDSGATIPLRDAMKSYANSDIVPMKDGRPRNISVLEETDYMLHYLVTAYEELPALYKPYDDALSKLKDYNQHDLKLKVKFHSWGSSGDKDGNKNVNAASTLYAIAAHYDTMLEMYARDLNYLATDKQGADSKITILDPELQAWDARIRTAREAAASARFFAKEAFTGKKPVSAQELEKKQQELATAVSALDQNALLQALDNYPHKPNIDVGRTQRALDTTRRLRTFGFTLGHIEYRETSEVFTRITKELLGEDYAKLIPPEDATPEQELALDKERSALLGKLLKDPAKMETLRAAFAKLAAEGEGKAKFDGSTDYFAYQTRARLRMAQQFPQVINTQVLAECQGACHMLEALLMQHLAADHNAKRPTLNIVPLFEDAKYLQSAPTIIKNTLDQPAYKLHMKDCASMYALPLTQQVQFAHSDNARRNGMPAARGLIYAAHHALTDTLKNSGVALQFYEGGSHSDVFRGGARPLAATLDEFGLHDFFKSTYQGGDLLNYFNQPGALSSMLATNLCHSAARLAKPERAPNANHDTQIVERLVAAKTDYDRMFGKDHTSALSGFMKAVGYNEEATAGANGSRATARGGDEKVDVTGMRTISFSEALQHAGITPTWLGLGNYEKGTNPAKLHRMYESSPIFRDIVDRATFGLMRSDLDYARTRSNNHELVGTLETEYRAVFDLCYKAITGKALTAEEANPPLSHIRSVAGGLYAAHAVPMINDQDGYVRTMQGIKQQWLGEEGTPKRADDLRLLHNAMDTVYHGRLPLLDNPVYAAAYCKAANIKPAIPMQQQLSR